MKPLPYNKPRSAEAVLRNRALAALIIAVVFLLGILGAARAHTPATQTTTPLGYFRVTVSPVYESSANACDRVAAGENIIIRCRVAPLIETPIEITSVEMLLFDSHDSVVGAKTMTIERYLDATSALASDGYLQVMSSSYITAGDEASFKIKVNYTLPSGGPEEYSECTEPSPIVGNMLFATVSTLNFLLDVSPAEVWANVGEQIEICCSIGQGRSGAAVNVTSIYAVLFDSYGSIIREQAMVTGRAHDGYASWLAHTKYTIVGDEAYFRLRVNLTFRFGPIGDYSGCLARCFPIVVNQKCS